MTPLIAIPGSYVQDLCWRTERLPALGETRIGKFSTGAGGKGFNQAIACLRQGASVRFLAAIGDDAQGMQARAWAAQQGLACEWQLVPDAPTASASIVVDAQGHNLLVVDLGANERLDAQRAAAMIEAGTRVVLTQLETTPALVEAVLRRAREVDALALLNPAPLHPGLSPEVLALADIITPNETEFAALLQMLGVPDAPTEPWMLADLDLHALCRCTGIPSVVLTLAAHGCFVSHGRQRRGDSTAYYRVPAEVVAAVDSTGAGDAFSGGLAAALALAAPETPFRAAVEHANRVAALSVERHGTAPAMPTRAEVDARFAPPA